MGKHHKHKHPPTSTHPMRTPSCILLALAAVVLASSDAAPDADAITPLYEPVGGPHGPPHVASPSNGKAVALKWSDCSYGRMPVKGVNVNFNANPAPMGGPLVVKATGNVNKAITSGKYSFVARALGFKVASHTDTVCGTTKFNIFGIGTVTVKAVDCKNTPAGPIGIEIDMNLPPSAPSIPLDIKVTGSDSSGGLFCVDVKARVGDGSEADPVMSKLAAIEDKLAAIEAKVDMGVNMLK